MEHHRRARKERNDRMTNLNANVRGALALLIIVSSTLMLIGCATSQITVSLNIAAMAVSAASSTISTIDLDPSTKTQTVAYLAATGQALTSAAGYIKSGTITPAQVAQISTALSAAAVPILPDTVPPKVRGAISAVTSGVQAFLSLLEGTKSYGATRGSAVVAYKLQLTRGDSGKIAEAQKMLGDADRVLAKLKQ